MPSLPFPGWGGRLLLAALALTGASTAARAAPLSPDEAVSAALSAPSVQEAEAALAAAEALRGQSALLRYNPQLAASQLGGELLEVDLLQPLSIGGEGLATRRMAGHSAKRAEAAARRARLEVAAGARVAYAQAVVAQRQLEIAASGLELATQLTGAVQRKYEEGEASMLDLRLARMSEAQASSRLLAARATQTAALRALSQVTGLVVDGEDLLDDPLASAPQVRAPSAAERSDVASARAALAAAEAELSRQRAMSLPVVSLGLSMDRDGSSAVYGPAVSLSVPLFDRNQSGRAGAGGAVGTAEARLARAEAGAETERRTAELRSREAEDLIDRLGEDLVGEGDEALHSVNQGYAAGELDLIATVLLQAQILSGQAAAVGVTGRVAAARIDLLLATEDNSLLPGGGR